MLAKKLVKMGLHGKTLKKLGLGLTEQEELNLVLGAIDRRLAGQKLCPEWGRDAFLRRLAENAKILDVGCGNNSPQLTKAILPGCHYVGLDIGDYNQKHPELADRYVITSPEAFTRAIADLGQDFDAVVSSHNLEHCDDRDGVLANMLGALKPGGMLYLAFPSADSVTYPSRAGTLNYHDDKSHQRQPPDFGEAMTAISLAGFDIVYASSRYQPAVRWLIGLYHERRSAANKSVDAETWALWGFEAIIWARKRPVA